MPSKSTRKIGNRKDTFASHPSPNPLKKWHVVLCSGQPQSLTPRPPWSRSTAVVLTTALAEQPFLASSSKSPLNSCPSSDHSMRASPHTSGGMTPDAGTKSRRPKASNRAIPLRQHCLHSANMMRVLQQRRSSKQGNSLRRSWMTSMSSRWPWQVGGGDKHHRTRSRNWARLVSTMPDVVQPRRDVGVRERLIGKVVKNVQPSHLNSV